MNELSGVAAGKVCAPYGAGKEGGRRQGEADSAGMCRQTLPSGVTRSVDDGAEDSVLPGWAGLSERSASGGET